MKKAMTGEVSALSIARKNEREVNLIYFPSQSLLGKT